MFQCFYWLVPGLNDPSAEYIYTYIFEICFEHMYVIITMHNLIDVDRFPIDSNFIQKYISRKICKYSTFGH